MQLVHSLHDIRCSVHMEMVDISAQFVELEIYWQTDTYIFWIQISTRFVRLLFFGKHWINALPSVPSGQLHIGKWFIASHIAFRPHAPGQGSTHFLLRQALLCGQSLLSTHSGRQPVYGFPWYSGKHVQMPSLHKVLEPHGEGLHLSAGGIGSASCTIGRQLVNGSPL